MADVDTALLSSEHAAIRHDVGLAEANIRDKVGSAEARLEKAVGDNRYTIANEAGKLSAQIGAEACAIQKHIGDTRQEDAENFGHTRRDIQATAADVRRDVMGTAGDIRREQAVGFGDTRYNIAERAGDIRRELATGFDKTGDLIGSTSSDIRLEQQRQAYDLSKQSGQETNEIVKEGLKGDYETQTRINGLERAQSQQIDAVEDVMNQQFMTVSRDTADLRAQVTGLGYQVRDGFLAASKDIELNALKTQIEAQKNTQYLADKITMDGEKTRGLINDLKYHDLSRGLVERNAALVECESDRRHYRDRWYDGRFDQVQAGFQGQWAQLQSQIQAFQSQLQETRQGMVNFGTMAGVGQSSTSNNVR